MGMHRLLRDERASLTSAILPMLLATTGLLLLAGGAVLSLVPLLVLGAGLAVIGVVMYLLSVALDQADRSRQQTRTRARADAEKAFATDQAHIPRATRSPLADEAVAALTGSTQEGGIYPPLGTSATSTPTAPARSAVGMWEPGASPTPAGFNGTPPGDLVEFQQVDPQQVGQLVAAGSNHVEWDRQEASAARPADHDFRIWPGAKEANGWTTFTGERKPRPERASEEDIRTAMAARRKDLASRLPTVGAILSHVDERDGRQAGQADMTKGRCSQCESVLWAPKQRPILLKCPGCGHKARLF